MQRFGLRANDPFVQSNRCLAESLCWHFDLFSFFAVLVWIYSLHVLSPDHHTGPLWYYALYLFLCMGWCKRNLHSTYCRVHGFIQKAVLLLVPIFLYLRHWETPATVILVLWSGVSPVSAILQQKRRAALLWLGIYVICMMGVCGFFCCASSPFSGTKNVEWVSSLNGLCVMLCVLAVVYRYVHETRKNMLRLLIQYRNHQIDTTCTQKILANIFPEKILMALKNGQKKIVEHISYANIIVATIVPCTDLSDGLQQKKWVSVIHPIFGAFDDLTTQWGVEKIKTMGDTYLAIGYPAPFVLQMPEKMLLLALGFRDIVQGMALKHPLKIAIRVGIASGCISAGVLGNKKPAYDVWGETVCIAHHLSQHGHPGCIWLDDLTKRSVQPDHFLFGPAQSMCIGAQITIQTYALLGTPQKQQRVKNIFGSSPVQSVKTGTGCY